MVSQKSFSVTSGQKLLTLGIALASMIGCNQSGPTVKTVAAKGVVTYNGRPEADVTITFLGNEKVRSARATSDANGNFVLTTASSGDGAEVGTYQVTATKTVAQPGAAASTGPMSMEDAAKASKEGKSPEGAKQQSLIPEKYASAKTSGLSFTVDADGSKNNFKIELKD